MRALFRIAIAIAIVAAIVAALTGPMVAARSGPQSTQSPVSNTAPVRNTGAISGAVRNGLTGKAIAGAVVTLTRRSSGVFKDNTRALTDAQGRFVFRDLPPADGYSIVTSRPGFVDGVYGQSQMFGPSGTIVLTEGQWIDRVAILMWKPGAISGRVLDEHHDPVVGVYVRVLAPRFIAGQERFFAGASAKTNDRGDYRIAGLSPGRYLIHVPSVQTSVPGDTAPGSSLADLSSPETLVRQLVFTGLQPAARGDASLDLDAAAKLIIGNYATPPPPAGGVTLAYPMTFFPGVATAVGASSVDLGLGEERAGVDIALQPVPTSRVSGVVEGPAEALAGLTLHLRPVGLEDLATGGEAATALVGHDGHFMFLDVPAGSYEIDSRRATTELTLQQSTPGAGLPEAPGARTSTAESGSITSSPPGTGFITRTASGVDLYWTRTPVTVGASDLSNLVVPLRRSVSVSGRFVFEGTTLVTMTAPQSSGAGSRSAPTVTTTTAAPPIVMPAVFAEPATGDPTLGRPHSQQDADANADHTFLIDGLRAGEYVLRVAGRTGTFAVKSIALAGRDITNTPLDTSLGRNITDVVITLTDQVTTVNGFVKDDQNLATEAAIIAFPVEHDQWARYGFSPSRILAAPMAGKTGYRVQGLPAGEYYIIAVGPAEITAWQDPKFLERASALAPRVKLAWGDTRTLDLTLTRIH